MPLPTPPYPYNDSRLAYNEHCFFYNGEYSEICLNPPEPVPQIVIIGGGKSTQYRKPHNKLDILLTTHLSGVNNLQLSQEDEPKHVRFRDFYDDDPKVNLFEIKVGASLKKVEAYPKELLVDKASRRVEARTIDNSLTEEDTHSVEVIVKANLIKVKKTTMSGSLKGV